MNHSVLSFQAGSKTIRQLPQNYCIAHFDERQRCWLMRPDLACNKQAVIDVTLELMNHSSLYESDGLKLLAKLTPKTYPNE
jgi:hypothetical protein